MQLDRPDTCRAALIWAADYLQQRGIPDARLDADLLLASCLGVERSQLYLEPLKDLSAAQWRRFQDQVIRRGRREPLQYILGRQEFMSLPLEVSEAVLIPRPDTEVLVEAALDWAEHQPRPLRILDLCTGSGAIAVSLAYYLKRIEVWAGDISPDALAVARRNATACKVQVNFALGDLTEPFRNLSFHLVTANPPYIPSGEIPLLQPEVAKAEPRIALDGGADGLYFYRRLAQELPLILRPNGQIFLEIGWDQGPAAANIFRSAGFSGVKLLKDLGGRDRVLAACWLHSSPAGRVV